jgi:hypothetical protein
MQVAILFLALCAYASASISEISVVPVTRAEMRDAGLQEWECSGCVDFMDQAS